MRLRVSLHALQVPQDQRLAWAEQGRHPTSHGSVNTTQHALRHSMIEIFGTLLFLVAVLALAWYLVSRKRNTGVARNYTPAQAKRKVKPPRPKSSARSGRRRTRVRVLSVTTSRGICPVCGQVECGKHQSRRRFPR